MSRNQSDVSLKESATATALPTANPKTPQQQSQSQSNQQGHDTSPLPFLEVPPLADDACMINAMNYKGLDVLFVCTTTTTDSLNPKNRTIPQVLVIAARTRSILQTLVVPTDAGHIVAMTSHPVSGMVCIAFADGRVITYFPKPTKAVLPTAAAAASTVPMPSYPFTSPTPPPYSFQQEKEYEQISKANSNSHVTITIFGKYYWVTGVTAHCKSVFYSKDEKLGQEIFARTSNIVEQQIQRVHISLSVDSKLLVGHKDQLAVFDASPCDSPDVSAILNWTVRFRNYIRLAAISGDALAIAYALYGDNNDNNNSSKRSGKNTNPQQGVYTLIRERGLADMENDMDILDNDAQSTSSTLTRSSSNNLQQQYHNGPVLTALFYKAGPFLPHTSIVTRLSFRGRGFSNVKVVQDDEEEGVTLYGNDLLLTSCAIDGTMRIFGQSTWRLLYQWDTPPGNSRADWIQGITYFNVAELEALPNSSSSSSSSSSQRHPLIGSKGLTSIYDDKTTTSFSESLREMRNKNLPSGNATSQAGAWISELTFRGAEPALRLSRLSFVKSGGNDFTPAHFESIIATLPLGSLSPISVQRYLGGNEDSSLIVHGVWPAWDPWEGNTSSSTFHDDNVTIPTPVSAVSPNSTITSSAGVSHLPPTELRIYASDVMGNNAIILECPLWGDKNNGEFELGSPIRYAMKIKDIESSSSSVEMTLENDSSLALVNDPSTSIDFKSGKLCALVHSDCKKFEILWRSQGTMNVVREDSDTTFESYIDLSATPLPLSIATGNLIEKFDTDAIIFSKWWLDENFGDSCRLILLTKNGAIVVYEIPPLWTALEPVPSSEMILEYSESVGNLLSLSGKRTDLEHTAGRAGNDGKIYEIVIMPHPEYGIGVRLDVHREGQRIIVGSFKKHPLSGGMLPAEKSGKIKVGDVVLKVNNISFEGKSMHETIETMRSLGSKNPLTMVFRSADEVHDKPINASVVMGPHGSLSINTLAIVRDAVAVGSHEGVSSFILLPRQYGEHVAKYQREYLGTVPFLYASKGILKACWLYISNGAGSDVNTSNVIDAGSLNLNAGYQTPKYLNIMDMEILQTTSSTWGLAVSDESGSIIILMIEKSNRPDSTSPFPSLDMKVIETIDIVKLEAPRDKARHSLFLRAHSIDLFASFRPKTEYVNIWISNPAGKLIEEVNTSEPRSIDSNFFCTTISHKEEIHDLKFICSGFLDAFPWLIVAGSSSLSLYRYSLKLYTWSSMLEIKYSNPEQSSTCRPLDKYPHLIPILYRLMSASDESSIYRTDWHPDAIISEICTNRIGVVDAMKLSVPQIYGWLSKLNELTSFGIAPRPNNLACAPHSFYSFRSSTSRSEESMSTPMDDMPNFIEQLLTAIDLMEESKKSVDAPSKKESKDFKIALAMSESGLKSESKLLIDSFKDMTREDMHLLWSIGRVMLKHRDYNKVDRQGQLTCFSIDLMRQLAVNPYDKNETSVVAGKLVASSLGEPNAPLSQSSSKCAQISSSACLSALLSNTQGQILKATKSHEEKMDWPTARSLMLSFWLRSDKLLRNIVEEIGLEVYRKTRDIMECAIFLISSGNMKKLKALAATDRSDSGRKFLSFISDNDFSSQRGRAAAEKNAFSLLRKRRYMVSAAFFLLAQPPMLKNAFEIILTQLDDPSLAFMIARLMGNMTDFSSDGLQSLAMGSLRGMGGGGGFASGPTVIDESGSADLEDKFCEWKPVLTDSMRYVLSSRCLTSTSNDSCLQTTILLWLNRPNDAALCLIGRALNASRGFDESLINSRTRFLHEEFSKNAVTESVSSTALRRVNTLMDFVCRPFLLAAMKAPSSLVTASAVALSDALYRRGLEKSSIQILVNLSDVQHDKEASGTKDSIAATNPRNAVIQAINSPETNSIFESFDAHPTKKLTTSSTNPVSSLASESIFDSFSVPTTTPKTKQIPVDPQSESSSIFDSYSVPSVRKTPAGDPSSVKNSSIFDSFDVPAKKDIIQSNQTSNSANESSSIFDSFTVPIQAKKVASNSEPASSSIFDSFAVPMQTKKVTSNPEPASSSIFDSFSVPVQTKKATTNPVQASPSIFDSFDVPVQPKKANTNPVQASSSIFDSFDSRPPAAIRKPASIFDDFEQPAKKSMPEISVNENKNMSSKFNLEDEPKDTMIRFPTGEHTFISVLRANSLRKSTARRLIREIARILAPYQGDILYDVIEKFSRPIHPLLPSRYTQMFVNEGVEKSVKEGIINVLDDLCLVTDLKRDDVVDEALLLIGCSTRPRRIVFCVLLLCVKERFDLIEDILRESAQELVRGCDMFTVSNDDLIHCNTSKHYVSSQFVRRYAVVTCLQLEICLWLHRSSMFPMSSLTLKEISVGVRSGFLVASWARCHETLDGMIRSNPDCKMDPIRGCQLWSSIKVMNTTSQSIQKAGVSSSGGWEFLVDCRRAEATEMLRDRKPGSFLIRPHAGDQGVFTLSFKTNLLPSDLSDDADRPNKKILGQLESSLVDPSTSQVPARDDIVQHAIIRLSDSGFRCGHFGPFHNLQQLLEEISSSLPFNLLFSEPPSMAVIQNKSNQPSPNAAFIRKMALHGTSEHLKWNAETRFVESDEKKVDGNELYSSLLQNTDGKVGPSTSNIRTCNLSLISGMFSQVLTLSEIRKQICAIAAADYDMSKQLRQNSTRLANGNQSISEESLGNDTCYLDCCEEDFDVQTSRMVRSLLNWCRSLECAIVNEIAPQNNDIWRHHSGSNRIAVAASDTEVEAIPSETKNSISRGDALIRLMIQPSSGVTFRTIRVGDGGQSVVVVLFSRKEAISWLTSIGVDKDEEDAGKRLDLMERRRVIEVIELHEPSVGNKVPSATILNDTQSSSNLSNDTRYRFVDPWEVEVLESKEGESKAAALGRGHYTPSNLENVARAGENIQRSLGGLHLVELWNAVKGGIALTKAIASAYPPWERDAGGDSPISFESQFSNFSNSFSQHLYRNALFRRLGLPQRFIAVINAELLDLKNLTSPTGASQVVAFALARLKRSSSNAILSLKTRTLDSACTDPKKIGKASGPNAPGTWGSLIRFRFPLPEDVDSEGLSFDHDREALFNVSNSSFLNYIYWKFIGWSLKNLCCI